MGGAAARPPRVEALVDAVARERPRSVALVCGSRTWTYGELRDEMDRRAAVLAHAGLAEGRVAVTAEPQTDDLVLTFLACCRVGIVLCTLSPLLSDAELRELAGRVQANVSFTVDGEPRTVLGAGRTLPIGLPGCRRVCGASGATRSTDASAAAVIRPTSGSTGVASKLVVMPHRLLAWRVAARAWWETPEDIFYLPMRNHFAVVDVCYVLCSGATLILSHATAPRQIEAEMAAHRASVLLTVPSTLGLMASLECPPPRLHLKAIRTSAANLPRGQRVAAEARYGVPVVQLYGATESGFTFATTRFDTPEGSIGKPLRGVGARLIDDAGNPVARDEVGELVVHTPGVMLGYLGDPVGTNLVLRDGWLHTGDLARQDQHGFFTLIGRRDARINSRGFKILPEEIEDVLLKNPHVCEVAVTSYPDPLRGEIVVALIVPAGSPPATRDLTRFCRRRLAAYKVPRRFEFVGQLPRSALGKVRRGQLQRTFPAPPGHGSRTADQQPDIGSLGHEDGGDRGSGETDVQHQH